MPNLQQVLVHARVNPEFYARRGGWRYFQSETRIQTILRQAGLISALQWLKAVGIRLIIQVCIPSRLRGWLFRHVFREKV